MIYIIKDTMFFFLRDIHNGASIKTISSVNMCESRFTSQMNQTRRIHMTVDDFLTGLTFIGF